jgi:ABC-2 type transport system permease protein
VGQHAAVLKYLPENIMFNSFASIRPLHGGLSAWAGLGVLCAYAAAALAAGGWALLRRDA